MTKWDGFYPQHDCKKCGKPLNADGYHPAELYAGTYTGLCYGCEKSGPFVAKEHLDGAQTISYPPHCPSWRRDREEQIAYPDCPDCEGKGRFYVSRPFASGGGYYRYCPNCLGRFSSHPLRVWASNRRKAIYNAANGSYLAELRKRRLITKAKKGELPEELVKEISTPIMARYDAVRERFNGLCAVRGL